MEVEFKLFGSLTIRQFGYVALGVVTAFISWFIFSDIPILKFPIIGFCVIIGIMMALFQVNGRPFDEWLYNFIAALLTTQRKLWKKNNSLPAYLLGNASQEVSTKNVYIKPPLTQAVDDTQSNQLQNSLDLAEEKRLSMIENTLNSKSVNSTVQILEQQSHVGTKLPNDSKNIASSADVTTQQGFGNVVLNNKVNGSNSYNKIFTSNLSKNISNKLNATLLYYLVKNKVKLDYKKRNIADISSPQVSLDQINKVIDDKIQQITPKVLETVNEQTSKNTKASNLEEVSKTLDGFMSVKPLTSNKGLALDDLLGEDKPSQDFYTKSDYVFTKKNLLNNDLQADVNNVELKAQNLLRNEDQKIAQNDDSTASTPSQKYFFNQNEVFTKWSLDGEVRDEYNNPVSGVQLTLINTRFIDQRKILETDEYGKFKLVKELENGEYKLIATKQGYYFDTKVLDIDSKDIANFVVIGKKI